MVRLLSGKEPRLEFKVGDKVVYPNHGVGIIEKIQSRVLSGEERSFYTLRILSSDSTVMVPVGNTGAVGLRKVLSKKEIEDVYRVLRKDKSQIYADWKGRFQENSDRMRTGEIARVAEVLKGLSQLADEKTLSYRERKMLDRARFLVISEIAEALGEGVETVEVRIDEALAAGSKKRTTDH
jgi:CarD family transcriptional regulator